MLVGEEVPALGLKFTLPAMAGSALRILVCVGACVRQVHAQLKASNSIELCITCLQRLRACVQGASSPAATLRRPKARVVLLLALLARSLRHAGSLPLVRDAALGDLLAVVP